MREPTIPLGEAEKAEAELRARARAERAATPFVPPQFAEELAASVAERAEHAQRLEDAGVFGASFTITPGHPEPRFPAVTLLDQELDALRRFGAPAMIDHLQALAYSSAVAAGWHDPKLIEGVQREPSAGERVALIHEEATELMQYARDGAPASHYIEDGKPEGAGAELADIVIRCLDYAGRYEIPLGDIIVEKMLYNRTRAIRHGGRTL